LLFAPTPIETGDAVASCLESPSRTLSTPMTYLFGDPTPYYW